MVRTKSKNLELSKLLKNLLKFIIFAGIGVGILYFVYQRQSEAYHQECILKGIDSEDCSLVSKVYDDFVNSNLYYLFLVIILFTLSNISRALRWQMMLKPIGINAGFLSSFNSIMLGYFANLGLPRVGEFVRAGALAKKENVKFDKVMGTIVLDRIIDVISLLIVFIVTIVISSGKLLSFIKDNGDMSDKLMKIINNPVYWFIGISFLVLIFFILKSDKFKNSFVGIKILNFIKGILTGIKSIKSIENPGLFIFHSIFIWVMYFMMNYVGFLAFEPTSGLGIDAAIVVFTFGSLGMVIPSPGGMGTYHFLVIEALKLFGISGSDGFSYANIIFFSIQIFGIIFFGLIALIMLNTGRKKEINLNNSEV